MAATVEGLQSRLGIVSGQTDVLQTLIDDVESALMLLAGIKTVPSSIDALVYDIAVDAYRLQNPGSTSPASLIESVKEKDKEVKFAAGGSGAVGAAGISLVDIIEKRHRPALRRLRRLRW